MPRADGEDTGRVAAATGEDDLEGAGLENAGLDAIQGWLILLPFAALAWPGGLSLFDSAPDTVSVGIGAMALGAVPATLLATLRGRGGNLIGLPFLFILLAFAAFQVPRSSDSFGAWRALVGLAAAIGWSVSAASLGDHGRRVVARGLPLVTILLLAAAPFSTEWTGTLGNTGDLSEAALPGAVLGAGVFASSAGPLAVTGLIAVVAYALYAGLVPVYAGLLGLGAALVAAALGAILGRGAGRGAAAKRLRLLLIAFAIGVAPIGWTIATDEGPPESTYHLSPDSTVDSSAGERPTSGGVEFRRRTWNRMPDLVLDHLQVGVGPGQFQAAFPPYRDPVEIELSSFDREEPTPVEVEHAHNDWFTALAEYGSVGGGALVLFLLFALFRGALAVAGADETRRDFGLAAIAVLANAAVNSPLLYGPAAPLAAFVVLGVAASGRIRSERTRYDHLAPGLALAALVVLAPRALSYVQYGRAMAETATARIVLDDGREKLSAEAVKAILDRAASHRADSPALLELRALTLRRQGAPADEQRANLTAWLEVRPYSFAALLNSGVLEARDGQLDLARDRFVRALLLDAGHPGLLRNLVRLGCDRRSSEDVTDALDALIATGHAEPEFVRGLALQKMLEGRLDVARPLVSRWAAESGGSPVDVLDANATFQAQRRAERDEDEEVARAFRNATRVRFGQDDVKRGVPEQAVGNFRLAYQTARDAEVDTGAIRLHLAAARAATGNLKAARDRLDEGPVRREDYLRLSAVEREALEAAGLLSGAAVAEPR